jgi:hypothetical protein
MVGNRLSFVIVVSLVENASEGESRCIDFELVWFRWVMLPPAATLAMLEVRGERKYEGNWPKVSYHFCQELNPELRHDRGPCDCMS